MIDNPSDEEIHKWINEQMDLGNLCQTKSQFVHLFEDFKLFAEWAREKARGKPQTNNELVSIAKSVLGSKQTIYTDSFLSGLVYFRDELTHTKEPDAVSTGPLDPNCIMQFDKETVIKMCDTPGFLKEWIRRLYHSVIDNLEKPDATYVLPQKVLQKMFEDKE